MMGVWEPDFGDGAWRINADQEYFRAKAQKGTKLVARRFLRNSAPLREIKKG
jgi:hypothetical protein